MVDRSVRRLCIALNRFAESRRSPDPAGLLSRPQESQALAERAATTPVAITTMTDLTAQIRSNDPA